MQRKAADQREHARRRGDRNLAAIAAQRDVERGEQQRQGQCGRVRVGERDRADHSEDGKRVAAPDRQCPDGKQRGRQLDDRPRVQHRRVVGAGENDRSQRDEAQPDQDGGFREPAGKKPWW